MSLRIRNVGLRRVRVADIEDAPWNFREHGEQQTACIAGAINEIGYYGYPDVYETEAGNLRLVDGHLRKGHLLTKYGPDTEIEVNVTDFVEAEAKFATATHDPIGELATVSAENLDLLLREIQTGDAALQELLAGLAEENGLYQEASKDVVEDEPPPLPVVPVSVLGDIWLCGSHRVCCGDSTKPEDVTRLMNGERAKMMFTDPPYGVDYEGGHFHSGDVNIKRKREKLAADGDTDIYAKFLPVVLPHVDGPCYVWFAGSKALPVYQAVHDCGGIVSALLIWHKTNATYAAMNAQYKQRHEPLLYFKPKGSTLRWAGPTDACTLWEFKRDGQNEFHPTQKPVALAVNAMKNHDADTCADFFSGSGSTIMAGEQLGRRVFAMELSPAYMDVGLLRWQNLTEQPAILESTGETFEQVKARRESSP